MPAPNDLTPEEEQEFVQHGVQPAGPGKEPIVEGAEDVQDQGAQPSTDDQGRQRDAQGRFLPAGEQPPAAGEGEAGEGAGEPGEGETGEGEGGQPKMVPHQALHAERMARAAVARRAQLAESRLNALLAQQGGEQQEEGMPDINQDPAAYIMALEKRVTQFEQARAVESENRTIDQAIESDEELFKAQTPDYDTASDYFVKSRAAELLQFHTPQEAQQILTHEARQIAKQAWSRGSSLGETVYRLAMARGYNPNARAAQNADPEQGQRGNAGGPSAQDVVRGVQRGRAASRSLSGGGAGGKAAQDMNAEALLQMSDEEFEEYLKLGTKGADQRFAAIG